MNNKQNLPPLSPLAAAVARSLSRLLSKYVFHCRVVRNSLQTADAHKPLVIIANHQSALDFINIFAHLPAMPRTVISRAFYETLPLPALTRRLGFLPKQQFQTEVGDLRRMKEAVLGGEQLLIFPAGLMCEDGLSTPIPKGTYKFLKFMDADVYVARSFGTYFVNAKWRRGLRPGKTYLDIYKLFDREALAAASLEEIEQKTNEALLFDAYAEQESLLAAYKNGRDIRGLQNVLYACPRCEAEDSMHILGKTAIGCRRCGFKESADDYGFLHCENKQDEIRHVSLWNQLIYDGLKASVSADPLYRWEEEVQIHTLQKGKFRPRGTGRVSLNAQELRLTGNLGQSPLSFRQDTRTLYTLPFRPGRCFDIQNGRDIYRCFPQNPASPMKLMHLLKIFYEAGTGIPVKSRPFSRCELPFDRQ